MGWDRASSETNKVIIIKFRSTSFETACCEADSTVAFYTHNISLSGVKCERPFFHFSFSWSAIVVEAAVAAAVAAALSAAASSAATLLLRCIDDSGLEFGLPGFPTPA